MPGGKRTPIGKFVHSVWSNLNIRCARCYKNEKLILSLERPSIDRINNSKDYTIDNIRVLELSLNSGKDKTSLEKGTVICFACKQRKPLNDFYKRYDNKIHGRGTGCKNCEKQRRKVRAR